MDLEQRIQELEQQVAKLKQGAEEAKVEVLGFLAWWKAGPKVKYIIAALDLTAVVMILNSLLKK
jgi:hypothetical protein